MDGAVFKRFIEKYGEKNVMGFIFDNSSRELYTLENPFKWEDHVDEELETIVSVNKDGRGNPYIALHPIENIQKILIAHKDTNWDTIDYRVLVS